jgi:molecular chaperone HtpG
MSAQMQPFEAEVGRVLDLVINSLYQHREIFLREPAIGCATPL